MSGRKGEWSRLYLKCCAWCACIDRRRFHKPIRNFDYYSHLIEPFYVRLVPYQKRNNVLCKQCSTGLFESLKLMIPDASYWKILYWLDHTHLLNAFVLNTDNNYELFGQRSAIGKIAILFQSLQKIP